MNNIQITLQKQSRSKNTFFLQNTTYCFQPRSQFFVYKFQTQITFSVASLIETTHAFSFSFSIAAAREKSTFILAL